MKKLYILAALLMATTAAHAGNSISFELEGHRIHIEAPNHCDSLSCIKISAPGLSGFGLKDLKSAHDDDDVADNTAPVQNSTVAPVSQAVAAPQPSVAAVGSAPATAPATVTTATSSPTAPADVAPAAQPAETSAPRPAAIAAAPVQAATPLGVWATEENKGNVRVEPCGPNLCGYAVKTGEKVLINMKPSDTKWVGQIHDPDSGRNYDSTIAMKGPNSLRVQGCALGGLFCGGQTWSRVS
jgi:uncharacterized protein (DUF2147 family)